MSDHPEVYDKCLRCNRQIEAYEWILIDRIIGSKSLMPHNICPKCLSSYGLIKDIKNVSN